MSWYSCSAEVSSVTSWHKVALFSWAPPSAKPCPVRESAGACREGKKKNQAVTKSFPPLPQRGQRNSEASVKESERGKLSLNSAPVHFGKWNGKSRNPQDGSEAFWTNPQHSLCFKTSPGMEKFKADSGGTRGLRTHLDSKEGRRKWDESQWDQCRRLVHGVI